MSRLIRHVCCATAVLGLAVVSFCEVQAAPSAAQALGLKPVQSDVDYDTPTGDEVSGCTVEAQTDSGGSGWHVRDASGRSLRRFLDSNGDNRIDLWCYYKSGIEVYRDIDSDRDGKADQYRWLGTEGIRWGMDKDQDGQIDYWKMISAEEVTSEVVAALRTKDAGRFERLLLTTEELDALGLGAARRKEVAAKLESARERFPQIASQQKAVTSESRWVNLGTSRPGMVPAGTDGSTRDLVIYDNVSAIVETGTSHSQIVVGTLIYLGDIWRLIDAPVELSEETSAAVSGGLFFRQDAPVQAEVLASTEGLSEEIQRLIQELEQIDRAMDSAASTEQQGRLHARRADVLQQLVEQAGSAEEREAWLRQMADGISAAVQSGGYPEGGQRLKQLAASVRASAPKSDLAAHLEFAYLSAVYAMALTQPDADLAKVQEQWIASLRKFVQDYPTSEDAAEAMLQLAIGHEFAGETDDAVAWYDKIVASFRESPSGKKAAGAKRRLQSVGKPLELYGPSLDGKTVTLASLSGRVVLVHYWATWCEPCKQDMQLLKQLQAKYPSQSFQLIGINLDSDRSLAVNFLRSNPLPWPQLFEPGGLDSRLANELGILTLPTMILVGTDGKVISRSIHAGELEEELSSRLQ